MKHSFALSQLFTRATHGGIAVTLLVLLGMIAVIAGSTVMYVNRQFNQTVQQEQEEKAFHAAEAGVNVIVNELNDSVHTTESLVARNEPLAGEVEDFGTYSLTFYPVAGARPGQAVNVYVEGRDVEGNFCQAVNATLHRTDDARQQFVVKEWRHLAECIFENEEAAEACDETDPCSEGICNLETGYCEVPCTSDDECIVSCNEETGSCDDTCEVDADCGAGGDCNEITNNCIPPDDVPTPNPTPIPCTGNDPNECGETSECNPETGYCEDPCDSDDDCTVSCNEEAGICEDTCNDDTQCGIGECDETTHICTVPTPVPDPNATPTPTPIGPPGDDPGPDPIDCNDDQDCYGYSLYAKSCNPETGTCDDVSCTSPADCPSGACVGGVCLNWCTSNAQCGSGGTCNPSTNVCNPPGGGGGGGGGGGSCSINCDNLPDVVDPGCASTVAQNACGRYVAELTPIDANNPACPGQEICSYTGHWESCPCGSSSPTPAPSCIPYPACGDGICNEDPDDCRADCGGACGDGACNFLETATSCPGDCGGSPLPAGPYCPTPVPGPSGAPGFCGDNTCDAPAEDAASCPADCAAACGNGTCDAGETADSCREDCSGTPSACGDTTCDLGEEGWCVADCPATTGTPTPACTTNNDCAYAGCGATCSGGTCSSAGMCATCTYTGSEYTCTTSTPAPSTSGTPTTSSTPAASTTFSSAPTPFPTPLSNPSPTF